MYSFFFSKKKERTVKEERKKGKKREEEITDKQYFRSLMRFFGRKNNLAGLGYPIGGWEK